MATSNVVRTLGKVVIAGILQIAINLMPFRGFLFELRIPK